MIFTDNKKISNPNKMHHKVDPYPFRTSKFGK